MALKRCDRDYTPAQVFYIDVLNGIAIETHKRRKNVEAITWFSSDQARQLINDIKSCKR